MEEQEALEPIEEAEDDIACDCPPPLVIECIGGIIIPPRRPVIG